MIILLFRCKLKGFVVKIVRLLIILVRMISQL